MDGMFEFTITSVEQHHVCSSYTAENSPEIVDVVIVKYTLKNLGAADKLTFDSWDWSLDVYDETGEGASDGYIACDHDKDPSSALVGGTITASKAVGLYHGNNSRVQVLVEYEESWDNSYSATFTIPVTEAPVVEEPEEDPLNGCTVTLDATLPSTYSYYNSSDIIEYSCQVTEVTFEVSGDDLKLYFSGRKTYDKEGSGQSRACNVGWKLYDDTTNTVIEAGTVYTLSIAEGEGFVKATDTAYNCIEPNGVYRVVLLNVN